LKGLLTNRTIQFSKSSRHLLDAEKARKPASRFSRSEEKKPDRRITHVNSACQFRVWLFLKFDREQQLSTGSRRAFATEAAEGRLNYQNLRDAQVFFELFFD
jgi:hypothetical protein